MNREEEDQCQVRALGHQGTEEGEYRARAVAMSGKPGGVFRKRDSQLCWVPLRNQMRWRHKSSQWT